MWFMFGIPQMSSPRMVFYRFTAPVNEDQTIAETSYLNNTRTTQVLGAGVSLDSDNDGLPNALENTMCTDPNQDDSDHDGILDGVEDANHNGQVDEGETAPCKEDTDDDGMPDGWEVQHSLNPLVDDAGLDEDEDGLTNLEEYQHQTDPKNWDSDNDGMADGWEVRYNLNPLVDDADDDKDEDGYTNRQEYEGGSDPTDPASKPIRPNAVHVVAVG